MWLRPHITDRLDMELVDGFPLADAVGCGRPKPAVQFGCDGGLTSLDRLELELLEGSALAGAVGCGCEKAVQTGFTCRTDGLALQRVGTAHSYSGELGPAGLPGLPKVWESSPLLAKGRRIPAWWSVVHSFQVTCFVPRHACASRCPSVQLGLSKWPAC
eukprot:scaffold26370_cov17-Tisochrysis_lutea.AAC.1